MSRPGFLSNFAYSSLRNEYRIFFAVTVMICLALLLNFIEPLEVKTQDFRFIRGQDQKISKNVVLVEITNEDLAVYGPWPFKRSVHGKLIEKLSAAGASIIGFDIMFTTTSEVEAEDDYLAAAIKKAGNVILAWQFMPVEIRDSNGAAYKRHEAERNLNKFADAFLGEGLVNVDFDHLNPDGVIRNINLFGEVEGKRYPSLAFMIVHEHLKKRHPGISAEVAFGGGRIRLFSSDIPLYRFFAFSDLWSRCHESYIIKYNGDARSGIFQPFSYAEILDIGVDPSAFRGKVVLVGAQSSFLKDIRVSPLGTMPGMIMNAQMIDNIIERDFIRRLNRPASCVMVFLLGAAAFAFLVRVEPSFRDILILLAFLASIAAIEHFAFVWFKVLAEMVAPLLEVAAVAVLIRFYQLFIKLHLTNLDLLSANEKLERKVAELSALYDISRTITATPDPDALFNVILKKTIDIVGAEYGAILIMDEDDGTLKRRIQLAEKFMDSPDMVAVAGEAFRTRKVVMASRETDYERYRALFDDAFAIGTIMCIPLNTYKGDMIGVIVLIDKKDGENFNDADVQLTSVIATQAGFAIENANLYQLAVFDNLTTLFVRRYFLGIMNKEFKRVRRYSGHVTVAMTDIDHFKKFNDTYGHQIGDLVLREVALIVKDSVRETDIAARYGGEEFIIALPETDRAGALIFADRLRKAVEEKVVDSERGPLRVTISIGLATFSHEKDESGNKKILLDYPDVDRFIGCADVALYKSKENGRNRATIYEAGMTAKH